MTTVRPLAETRREAQPPSKRIMLSIALIGIAVGALVVMAQGSSESVEAARRALPFVELVAERVAREAAAAIEVDAEPEVTPAPVPSATAEPSSEPVVPPPPPPAWKAPPPPPPPPTDVLDER